ncbi:hypothetical protein DEDE109153_07625 [Deinococcus deserti]|uniref:Lipoprotein n=1 Tax=Deinococcus deserti (strain DSM 17065 / CIP 109153 / LMG 22923 / VCD115) TaxID=546414 RepID=X5HN33_DEIDV|nr:hypothetical protein [Deinococcus deserti]AHX26522.1 hypothetical protein Deide_15544 [Deinococcus deserti VCD115]
MKRAALACLLVLIACQKRDPAGTLTPTANNYTSVPSVVLNSVLGENVPMRLASKDYLMLVSYPDDMEFDRYSDCDLKVELRKHRAEQGENIYSQMAPGTLDSITVALDEPGLYRVWIAARHDYCAPTLVFQPVDT